MYTILFENEYNKQYCSDYYFENVNQVTDYLLKNEYTLLNRIYYKGKVRAYVQPLSKYGRINKNKHVEFIYDDELVKEVSELMNQFKNELENKYK